ncbi:MAG: hypothetical protein MJZ73_06875 [Bacteroidaceae bacterium]|nr:hypothetical protein [Bacteroidaceae bacterium]
MAYYKHSDKRAHVHSLSQKSAVFFEHFAQEKLADTIYQLALNPAIGNQKTFRELVVCKGAINDCILKNPCNLPFGSKFSVKNADFVAQLYNFCNFADGKKN